MLVNEETFCNFILDVAVAISINFTLQILKICFEILWCIIFLIIFQYILSIFWITLVLLTFLFLCERHRVVMFTVTCHRQ